MGVGAAGTAGTVSAGGGLFFGGGSGVSAGGVASGGATAYAGSHVLNAPAPTMGAPTAVGAGIGPIGGGIFLTNAGSPSQLAGPFLTIGDAVDAGLGLGVQISFGTDAAGHLIWQAGITMGVGAGTYGYALTTKAAAGGTGVRCE